MHVIIKYHENKCEEIKYQQNKHTVIEHDQNNLANKILLSYQTRVTVT